jgi:protein-disulfide isomerase
MFVVLAVVALPIVAHAQRANAPDPAALQKRNAALEAGQKEILKELQEIKALLQPKTATAPSAQPAAPASQVSIANSPSRGDVKAKVTIVEFSDFECPFCGRYTRETYQQIQHEYVDTGKVRYVFRNLPIESLHPKAFGAAIAGECAREQGKFWEMHDEMFRNQRALAQPGLVLTARTIGLDVTAFERCLATEGPQKKVRQDMADAASLAASATPVFFFAVEEKDGKALVLQKITGAKTFAVFKTALDTLLNSPAFKQ